MWPGVASSLSLVAVNAALTAANDWASSRTTSALRHGFLESVVLVDDRDYALGAIALDVSVELDR